MRERDVEAYFVKRVKALGGFTRKLKWIGHRGAHDRFVAFNPGLILLVEVKRPGKKLDPHQQREHRKLEMMGVPTWTVDSVEAVNKLICFVQDVIETGKEVQRKLMM